MTYPINCPNQQIPSYSGVTINISNPAVNTVPQGGCIYNQPPQAMPIQPNAQAQIVGENNMPQQVTQPFSQPEILNQAAQQPQQAYPPQYYLNNYNYMHNSGQGVQPQPSPAEAKAEVVSNNEEMDASKEIIDNLDSRSAEQKELEKNGKQQRVVNLTNEYIMSLENYLNNPNTEIRLMAAKEILTRLDEDKNRYDDAALNALLNKMLQDPEKLIRIAALSAFSSQLASGNDYTVKLLNDIQQNPNSDKEDVVEAANILLKMSAETEIKYTPVSSNNPEQKVEQ